MQGIISSRSLLQCSGHGYYDSVLGCVCDDGWTGLGDFSIIDGVHCGIDTYAVQIMSCVALCSNVVCTILILRYLAVRVSDKKSLCIISLDPKIIFPLTCLAFDIDNIFYAALKIMYHNQQVIGRDVFITVLMSFNPIFAQVGLVFYFFVVIKCLEKYVAMMPIRRSERLERQFSILITVSWVIPPVSIFAGIMPSIGLLYPQYWYEFGMMYHIGTGANAWLYGILIGFALRLVVSELECYAESFQQVDRDIQIVLRRLRSAYVVLVGNCFLVGLTSIIFGANGYLMDISTFLLLYDLCTVPISGAVLILTLSKISRVPRVEEIAIRRMSNLVLRTLQPATAPVFPIEYMQGWSEQTEP